MKALRHCLFALLLACAAVPGLVQAACQNFTQRLPVPEWNQVLIKLKAAALNRRDLLVRSREQYRAAMPFIPGSDGAGIVTAVGPGADQAHVGDEVVVYPSLCEGFGMPIIEAMLLNPHTTFSNTTAMADFCVGDDNTFDPTDIDDIVESIRTELEADDSDRSEWARKRAMISEKYNWTTSARVLLEMHEPDPARMLEANAPIR